MIACSVCLCTPMQSRCQIIVPPSLTQQVLDKDWSPILASSVFEMWDTFTSNMSSFLPGCFEKGTFPKFKVRDEFRYSQVAEKVRDAIAQEDYAYCNLLLTNLHRISERMLSKWRQGLSPKQCPRKWTSHIARWIRKSAPPLPFSIECGSDANARTVGVREMQKSVYAFYNTLFNRHEHHNFVWAPCEPSNTAEDFSKVIPLVLGKMNVSKATGLDGIHVKDFKFLPNRAIADLSKIFARILVEGRCPPSWLNLRLVLIPKKGGSVGIKDLRPISVASVAYRIFAKSCLLLCQNKTASIHARSVGGVPSRSGEIAYLKVGILLEKLVSSGSHGSGIGIDTQKFFDSIPFDLAVMGLRDIGVPDDILRVWISFIQSVKRFVTIHDSILDIPISCSNGVPQGDPISMLSAAACLSRWLHNLYSIPDELEFEGWVFVDDRMLLAGLYTREDVDIFQHLFASIETWDDTFGFNTRPKSVQFSVNGPSVLHWKDGNPVDSDTTFTYLGVPLPLPKTSRARFFADKVAEAQRVFHMLQKAGENITKEVCAYVYTSIILPKFAYTSSMIRPVNSDLDAIRGKGLSLSFGCPLSNHNAVLAFVLPCHRFDPKSVLVYSSLSRWERVFQKHGVLGSPCDYSTISGRKSGLGPIRLFLDDLSYLNWHIRHDGCISTHCQFLWIPGKTDLNLLKHHLRDALRRALLLNLGASWEGCQEACLEFSRKLIKAWNRQHPLWHVLARTLSNAHPTPLRLWRMNKQIHSFCPYCQGESADIYHFLNECPKLQHMRDRCPIIPSRDWPRCAQNMLVCTVNMPVHVQNKWDKYQLWACETLSLWMAFERESRCSPDKSTSTSFSTPEVGCIEHPRTQWPSFTSMPKLNWSPFTSRAEWTSWRGSLPLFANLFLFWSLWSRDDSASSEVSWLYAFTLFLESVGPAADCFKAKGLTVLQATFSFRNLSEALWTRCGISVQETGQKRYLHRSLPAVWPCPFGFPPVQSSRVFPSVLSGHLRNKFEMNLGEHLAVLVEDLDGCHSRDVVSLVSSLRKPLPKISAPPWWSVCSQICQAADCRYKSVDDKIFVRAGGGLEQFLAEDLPILPHDAILSALGCKLPLASLLALQRTWAKFKKRIACYKTGHLIGAWTFSRDFKCCFCGRAPSMCDSKRAHSSCSGPEESSLAKLASFCDQVLGSLQTVINKVQFCGIELRVGENGAPVLEDLLESLLSDAQSLDSQSLSSFLDTFCTAPKETLSLSVCRVVGPAQSGFGKRVSIVTFPLISRAEMDSAFPVSLDALTSPRGSNLFVGGLVRLAP